MPHCAKYVSINGQTPERPPITPQFRVELVSVAGTFGHISRNSICIYFSTAIGQARSCLTISNCCGSAVFGVLTAVLLEDSVLLVWCFFGLSTGKYVLTIAK